METVDVRDLFLQMREKEYKEYEEDVEIAVDELTKMKLYPIDGEIVLDLYAIPSNNRQSYYAIVYDNNGRFDMVYAKPQFYEPITQELIKMYRFKDAKEVEGHPVKDGKIIMGVKPLSGELLDTLLDITDSFPSVRYDSEEFTIDGCFQAIRIYKDDNISSEVSLSSGDELVLPKGKEYLANLLYNLYIEIGRLIE
jgi:hypothetical protein